MKININEIKFTIKKATEDNKHPNLLAYINLILEGEMGEYLSISGFTLWQSKFDGYNIEMPGKKGFKYFLSEKSLWRKIKQEIIKQYDYMIIPVVEDDKDE